MTISTKRQSLSNMLRRLFTFLILGGFIASCSCEPVNRKLLQKTSEKSIECVENEGDKCETNKTINVSPSNQENQTWISNKIRQIFLDDGVGEVSARKKDKKKDKYGKYIFLMMGAMKAALVYGVLHGVAALAGKAILIAKVALAVAIAAMLKKNDHQEKVSYEIVRHPHTSYVQTHSSSVDYDHRSDYGDDHYDRNEHYDGNEHSDRNDHYYRNGVTDYEHRKRRRIYI